MIQIVDYRLGGLENVDAVLEAPHSFASFSLPAPCQSSTSTRHGLPAPRGRGVKRRTDQTFEWWPSKQAVGSKEGLRGTQSTRRRLSVIERSVQKRDHEERSLRPGVGARSLLCCMLDTWPTSRPHRFRLLGLTGLATAASTPASCRAAPHPPARPPLVRYVLSSHSAITELSRLSSALWSEVTSLHGP